MNTIKFYTALLLSILMLSCGSKTEMTEEKTTSTVSSKDSSQTLSSPSSNEMHEVKVQEVIQAERYTYLKVQEKSESFWIATLKIETAKPGETYLYRGGLLKTNFESQEHHRTFDKIYLVSEIINANAHPGGQSPTLAHNHPIENSAHVHSVSQPILDAIPLKELLSNPKKFEGKIIKVTGTIVKANYGIMNSNWYHLQDGSTIKGKAADLVITSKTELPQGQKAGFSGKVILNKNLGSGYFFPVLIENAEIL